jgi:hypothetical protein
MADFLSPPENTIDFRPDLAAVAANRPVSMMSAADRSEQERMTRQRAADLLNEQIRVLEMGKLRDAITSYQNSLSAVDKQLIATRNSLKAKPTDHILRQKAKSLLQKRHALTKCIENQEHMYSKIETLHFEAENAKITAASQSVMREAVQYIRSQTNGMSVDSIVDSHADAEEAIEQSGMLQLAASKNLESSSSKSTLTNDQLEDELDQFLREDVADGADVLAEINETQPPAVATTTTPIYRQSNNRNARPPVVEMEGQRKGKPVAMAMTTL